MLDDDEDGDDRADIGPWSHVECRVASLGVQPGDDASGDEADDIADVGDDADDGEEDADDQRVGQAEDGEGDSDEESVDQRDEHLAAEEGDEVAIDFLQGVHQFAFKARGAERDVVVPMGANAGGIFEEEEKIDGYHDHADGEAENAENFRGACGDPCPCGFEDSAFVFKKQASAPAIGEGGERALIWAAVWLCDWISGFIDLGEHPSENIVAVVLVDGAEFAFQLVAELSGVIVGVCRRILFGGMLAEPLFNIGMAALYAGENGGYQEEGGEEQGDEDGGYRPEAADAAFFQQAHGRVEHVGDDACDDHGDEDWLEETEELTEQPYQADQQGAENEDGHAGDGIP